MNSNLKNSGGKSKYSRRTATILMVSAAVAACIIGMIIMTMDIRNRVDVLQVKSGEVISKGTQITSDLIEKHSLTRREYTKDMCLWKNKDKYEDKYANNFMRGGNSIHIDEVTDDKPVRNKWLYGMDIDHEALTIQYDPMKLAGKLILPGDKVRIRVTYTNTDGSQGKTEEVLFDSIEVKDILNSEGKSIYDINQDLSKLNDADRAAAMKSSEYATAISPTALMVEATKADAEKYSSYQDKNKATFSLTLLSRNGNDDIQLDQIPTITSQVSDWVKNGKDASASK